MEIKRVAKAGTLESNDIMIMISPNEEGTLELRLESIVMKQFGKTIERVIMEKLSELKVTSAVVVAQDKGALDYTIRARVETAVKRAI